MKRKILFLYSFLFVAIVFGGFALANSKTNILANKSESIVNDQPVKSADKLEVYYFHRTQRCSTCLSVGRYTKELIQQKFSTEVERGLIEFREINIDLPENAEIVNKFKVSGQSLYINVIKDNSDNINQDINIWRLAGSEGQFKDYLQNKITGLLAK